MAYTSSLGLDWKAQMNKWAELQPEQAKTWLTSQSPLSQQAIYQYLPSAQKWFPEEEGESQEGQPGSAPTTISGQVVQSGQGGKVLTGAPALNYDPAYGGIPQVPSPSASATQATSANLSNLPGLLDLAGQINAFNLAQQRQQYEASFPNYAQMEAQVSQNLLSGARGELSEGTMQNLRQEAAERGVAIGQPSTMGGPTVSNMNLLRNMGLTTEQLQQQSIAGLGAFNATSPRTALYNPATMFITPEQQYQAALLANIYAAAPVPSAAAEAAMAAARAGANFGYKGAISPTQQGAQGITTPSGQSGSASIPTQIVQKYAPSPNYMPNYQAQSYTAPEALNPTQGYLDWMDPYIYGVQDLSTGSGPLNPAQGQGYLDWLDPYAYGQSADYSSVPQTLYPAANDPYNAWYTEPTTYDYYTDPYAYGG